MLARRSYRERVQTILHRSSRRAWETASFVVVPRQDTATGASGYTVDLSMRSFWEAQTWLEADVVIVGAGLVGVQTAIAHAAQRPRDRVLLLERGYMPTGASTRNAGFACIGSVSEVAVDVDLHGPDRAVEIVQMRSEGLAGLLSTCEGHDVGFTRQGGHEIFLDEHPALQRIDEINELLQPVTGLATFERHDAWIAPFGFAPSVQHLVSSPVEGTLDSGKLLDVLWGIAQHRGVMIRTGVHVVSINEGAGTASVYARVGTEDVCIRAGSVVVATNAWIPELVHDHAASAIIPARGQIIVTEPVPSMPLTGSYHFDEGYVYFRPVGNRILLGGARNLDFNAEQTTSHDVSQQIQEALETLLRDVIAPSHTDLRIDHRWSGTMAFSPTKQPIIDRVSPHVIVAFGCNGMGVALSSSIAKRVTELLNY
ncbi:MAG: FAD-binding oxidoreductase [Candidatus Kapabacteria bacterium]|nr:FAD-binding oxidoreductase [Candidatus Kapabacteria bacterium]